jgi:hypothetical protein
MAQVSRLFRESISATLLRSAALAIALIVLASPARAETVTLVCQPQSGDSFTLRIDYDRAIIEMLEDNGAKVMSLPAKITDENVTWDGVHETGRVDRAQNHFWGSLNRLSGQLMFSKELVNDGYRPSPATSVSGCRRATKKF